MPWALILSSTAFAYPHQWYATPHQLTLVSKGEVTDTQGMNDMLLHTPSPHHHYISNMLPHHLTVMFLLHWGCCKLFDYPTLTSTLGIVNCFLVRSLKPGLCKFFITCTGDIISWYSTIRVVYALLCTRLSQIASQEKCHKNSGPQQQSTLTPSPAK